MLGDASEVLDAAGFDEIGIGAEVVGAVDVAGFIGRGEDHDEQASEAGLAANPFEDFKSVDAGHFNVKEEHFREGIFLMISGFEVANGLLAVLNKFHTDIDAGLEEGSLQQIDVIGIVIGHQNCFFC